MLGEGLGLSGGGAGGEELAGEGELADGVGEEAGALVGDGVGA